VAGTDRRKQHRYWLHAALFVATFATSTAWGARLAWNFQENIPPLSDDDLTAFARLIHQPSSWLDGLPFSVTLLTILMAHELGHYFACLYYRVDASLPYFLPAPTLIGTFGAFIRIRSPIFYRTHLFDIGIAGPIAGFVPLLPAMALGVALSKAIPGIGAESDIRFGVPLLQRLCEGVLFPGVPSADIYLHPVARAAWAGTLATALNLLPIGQLDGGHILYSLAGKWHKLLSRIFLAALVALFAVTGYIGWLVWAVLLSVFALRHPVIHDSSPLGAGRSALAAASLAVLVLCFTVIPMTIEGLWE
jgi:membrane-associated protease RseP (regulator of RpoE activity)